MDFSSIPAYLDPSNWQQQSTHETGNNRANPQFLLPPPPPTQFQPPPPPPPPQPHVVGNSGSIRPGSMADRARMANIPMPEAALKCPRCDSINTKFCYFNNYSLTQPRHFCKTCRRYWTRGGALRNVPVGGGCRRNKRSKGSSSKSPASSTDHQTNSGSTSIVSSNSGPSNILGLNPQIQALRFMSPFSHVPDYGSNDMGLNYSGISAPVVVATNEMNFQMGTNFLGGGGGASILATGGLEQWRWPTQTQQFPVMGGLDTSSCLFPFQSGVETSGYVGETSQVRPRVSDSMLTQMASVKMEDHNPVQSNLARQFLGIPGNNNNDQWSGSAWTDLSSFSSSSTSNP